MKSLEASRALAHCIAIDAGNRLMRRNWPRPRWTDEEYNAAISAYQRVWPLEAEYPWATPEQIDQMERDLGYAPQKEMAV